MFKNLKVWPVAAVGAVVLALAYWAISTQTTRPETTPVVQAADGPIVVAGDADPADTPDEPPVDTAAKASQGSDAEATQTAPAQTDSADAPLQDAAADTDQDGPKPPVATEPAPKFDIVRVEKDGMTVIAGTGPAGWQVSILVDGKVVDTVVIDGSGQFVAILDLGESDTARVVTLSARNGDTVLLSDAQVVIAPVVRQVAQAAAPQEQSDKTPPPDESATAQTSAAKVQSQTAEAATADATPNGAAATETSALVDAPKVAEIAAPPTDQPTDRPTDQPTEPVADTQAPAAQTTEAVNAAAKAAQDATPAATEQTNETVAGAAVETTAGQDATTSAQDQTNAETASGVAALSENIVQQQIETDQASAGSAGDKTTDGEQTAKTALATTDATDSVTAPKAAEATPAGAQPAAGETVVVTDPTAKPEPAPTVQAVEDTVPAVLLIENDSVKVLQPAAQSPSVMDQLSIAAISYADNGSVQLSGYSPAGFLRVYLNNIQIVTLEVPEPGEWSAELVDVAPGIYTLRVDQVDAAGTVVQRVETPFKRETAKAVADAAQTRKPLVSVQVVQPGSTLWAISRENYGSGILFVRIFEANKDQIRDPDLIYPGQIFELPPPPGAKKKKSASGQ